MNEQTIFLAALEIDDPLARQDYLNRTCEGNPTLRRQVESLLTAHERSGEFLDVPALRQIGPGDAERGVSEDTSAENPGGTGEIDLSFLQPSTAAGSLGRLGHYEIQEVIGHGGCGIVLKAFDDMLHRVVAIKVMAPQLAVTSPARKRFLREARATARIRHENVVSVHAVEEQPIPFLVMDYIAGETLQQKLDQSGPLDLRDVLHIGEQIARGLEAAHGVGLIHRDIKPGNILLEQGSDRARLTDFGLARAADDASVTQSGTIVGTPLYMSPEQARGEAVDQRSDQFSLGSVLYVMCSGRPPFRAATTLAVLKRVAEDQPRPIREIIPEVPEWLVAIIAKLHQKDPAERFASAREVAEVLGRCLTEWQQKGRVDSLGDILPMPKPAVSAPPVAAASKAGTARRRSWAAAVVGIVLLVVGFGVSEATGVTNVRGTVVRLFTPEGTLIVEVDDPGVSISIEGGDMVIAGAGAREIRLKVGQYQVLASKDGKVVRQELVTVTRDGRQVVRVSKEANPANRLAQPLPKKDAEGAIAGNARAAAFLRGPWRIVGDVIEQPERNQQAMLLFGTPEMGDGDFTCEAMRAEGENGLALVARATDLQHYYYFEVGVFKNSYHSIYAKEARANWRRIDQRKAPPVPTDRWVKLRLRLRGDLFEGYLDDQLVLSGKDDRRLKGYIGVRTWNEPGKYRNLKFTDPAGKVLWQGLPDISALTSRPPVADPIDQNSPPPSGPVTTPQRQALEWLLASDGFLTLRAEGKWVHLKQGDTLPTGSFEVNEISLFDLQELDDVSLENLKATPKVAASLRLRNIRKLGDAGLARLAAFPGFAAIVRLSLSDTGVTDAGLEHVNKFAGLTDLELGGSPVSAKGLAQLRGLKLQSLTFYECHNLSDDAMAELASFPTLHKLTLSHIPISDAGLEHLSRCRTLQALTLKRCDVRATSLRRTPMTEAGVKKLAALRPDLRIDWDGNVIEPKTQAKFTNALGMEFIIPSFAWRSGTDS